MIDEPELVTLFYHADWTRLSLSAHVREMSNWALKAKMLRPAHSWGPTLIGDLPQADQGEWTRRVHRARLRIAPGGRYRADILPVEDQDEVSVDHDRVLRRRYGTRPGLPPPYPELLWPSTLLNAFSLEVAERAEVAGRAALRVVATPAPGVWRAAERNRPERIEVVADAETGILLRFEEFFDGRTVQLCELTDVTFDPADEFSIPDDAEDDGDPVGSPPPFSGPGWETAKTAVNAIKTATNALGPVLGPAIRHAPPWRGESVTDDDPEAAMPPAGERFDQMLSAAPPSAELLHALHRSGRAAFSATLHHWVDMAALGEQARSWTSGHGWGGIGSVAGALTDRFDSSHQVTRVALGGDGRYRLDFMGNQRSHRAKSVACDGTQRWAEYDDRVIVGPMLALVHEFTRGKNITELIDTASLLASRVSSVAETQVAGRRGFAVRAAADGLPSGVELWRPRDSDVVVDAELGIVLRRTWYDGDTPVMRSEFRDVEPLAGDGSEFTPNIPPGIRVEHTDGGVLDELDLPPAMRSAIRSAGSVAKAAGSAAKAAAGLFDSLRHADEKRGAPEGDLRGTGRK
jgi:outer membrane lipoprotein-sorting protein